MNSANPVTGEQAWLVYKEIERVIEKRYHLSTTLGRFNNSSITMALQRLGEAVLSLHKLSRDDHKIPKIWILRLQPGSIEKLKLSTTEEMLHAKIINWEEGIASQKVGHDTWTEGRREGYRPQASLKEAIECDYYKIKYIVDIPPAQVDDIFMRIQGVVEIELARLALKDSSKEKIKEIKNALETLQQAIIYKYNLPTNESKTLSENKQKLVDWIDIYSPQTILDAKIDKWSLRQALNLSSDSLISKIMGLREALWDKATALENVEKALQLQE